MKPLFFKPRLVEKIWGGSRLFNLLKKGNGQNGKIGESWEISGYPGSETMCVTPPFENRYLNEVFRQGGPEIAGPSSLDNKDKQFPLLFKFIDASDRLSVQVHPPDRSEGDIVVNGKTECWYIVDALPGSSLISGFREGVSKKDIEDHINKGTLEELLNRVEIRAGDVVFIPAGCVHAITEGILLYEIQQTSDATYRLYDWNRKDVDGRLRELHVKESMEVVDTQWHENYIVTPLDVGDFASGTHTVRAACRYFAFEEFLFSQKGSYTLPARSSFNVMTCLCERASIEGDFEGGSAELKTGDSVLVPKSLNRPVISGESGTRLLNTWVPDLKNDVVNLCRDRGYRDEEIKALGGTATSCDIESSL